VPINRFMPTLVSPRAHVERKLWTDEEFLEWLQPGVHADLIAGKRYTHSPASLRHAFLLNFLDRLLAGYLEASGIGGELLKETVAVRLSPRDVFLPDLSWFSPAQVALLPGTHAPFAPIWVAEALSKRTANRDTGLKFAAYEQHGVQEYWILDPATLAHRFYVERCGFLTEFAQGEEIIRSRTISGFFVRRSWLNPDALLPVRDCLAEILAHPPSP
jgi:Uma2 family endonuclease